MMHDKANVMLRVALCISIFIDLVQLLSNEFIFFAAVNNQFRSYPLVREHIITLHYFSALNICDFSLVFRHGPNKTHDIITQVVFVNLFNNSFHVWSI
jgi:hypothetical protein